MSSFCIFTSERRLLIELIDESLNFWVSAFLACSSFTGSFLEATLIKFLLLLSRTGSLAMGALGSSLDIDLLFDGGTGGSSLMLINSGLLDLHFDDSSTLASLLLGDLMSLLHLHHFLLCDDLRCADHLHIIDDAKAGDVLRRIGGPKLAFFPFLV